MSAGTHGIGRNASHRVTGCGGYFSGSAVHRTNSVTRPLTYLLAAQRWQMLFG